MQEPLIGSSSGSPLPAVDVSEEVGAMDAGAAAVRRRIVVCGTAAGRERERSVEKEEARQLKAQGLPSNIQELWAKTGNHVQRHMKFDSGYGEICGC
jgi:hypothetical protein